MTDDESLARDVACIMGAQSAAAEALAELDRRRASGERDLGIFNDTQTKRWLVCPFFSGLNLET